MKAIAFVVAMLVCLPCARAEPKPHLYICKADKEAGWIPATTIEHGGQITPSADPFFVKWYTPTLNNRKVLVLPSVEITRAGQTGRRQPLLSCWDNLVDRIGMDQNDVCKLHIATDDSQTYGLPTRNITFDRNLAAGANSVNYAEYYHGADLTVISGGTCVLADP